MTYTSDLKAMTPQKYLQGQRALRNSVIFFWVWMLASISYAGYLLMRSNGQTELSPGDHLVLASCAVVALGAGLLVHEMHWRYGRVSAAEHQETMGLPGQSDLVRRLLADVTAQDRLLTHEEARTVRLMRMAAHLSKTNRQGEKNA